MRLSASIVLLSTLAFGQNPGLVSSVRFFSNSFRKNDAVQITYTVSNQSPQKVTFGKIHTPFEGFTGDFIDLKLNGGKVRYIGAKIKRGPTTAEDFLTLQPGESKSVVLNLEDGYDISKKGTYTLSFKPQEAGIVSESKTPGNGGKIGLLGATRESRFDLIEEKPSKIKAIPKQSSPQGPNLKVPNNPPCSNCGTTELTNVRTAYTSALSLINTARANLEQTPSSSRSSAARYVQWFGAYDFVRYRTAVNHMQEIARTLRDEPVSFQKGPSKVPGTNVTSYFAYVNAAQPYTIFLGNLFWSAPNTGTDSRAGTIIHETSHFDIVANTDDIVYNQQECINLAKTQPNSAIWNADTHEYFSENTPAVSMPADNRPFTDFNDDGRADLMFFEPGNNSAYVTTSTGTGFWGANSGQWIGPNQYGSLKSNYFPADFNGDGITDLGYLEGNNQFFVNISTGTGFFGAGTGSWIAPNGWVSGPGRYYTGDFNGDGRADLMFFNSSNNSIQITTSTGTGFGGLHSGQWAGPNGFGSLVDNYFPADYDGDGITDLGYLEGNNSFFVWLSNGDAFAPIGASRWIAPNAFGGTWGTFYAGYFNNDRRADLMFFEPGNNSIHVITSTGTTFGGPNSGQWVGPNGFGGLRNNYFPADFNGDGLTDLGYLEGNNSFFVWMSAGTGFSAAGASRWFASNAFGGSWGKYYVGDCLNRK